MSQAKSKILEYIPFAKGKKKPTRQQALASIPVRNAALRWHNKDGEIHLFIPRKRSRVGDLITRLFRLPDEKQVNLDKVGSGVWELCDGNHSVEQILEYVQRRHKLSRREAEVSVSAYLKILADRRFIGILSPDRKERKLQNAGKKSKAGKAGSSSV